MHISKPVVSVRILLNCVLTIDIYIYSENCDGQTRIKFKAYQ